jgi:hypothetical protein
LFDTEREKITIDNWRNQIVYRDNANNISLTVDKIIRYWANKNGGAHIEKKRSEDNLYGIALFKEHLLTISEYLISDHGNDINVDIKNKVIVPFNQWIEKVE